MEEILRKLFEMTLYGSIAIVLVLIFRAIFNKVPKKVTTLFWIAAGIRLLCPINFDSKFGIMNLFEKKQVSVPIEKIAAVKQINVIPHMVTEAPKISVAPVVHEAVKSEVVAAAPERTISLVTVLFFVWAAGIALFAGYLLVQYIKLHKIIRSSVSVNGVFESDQVESPFVAGFLTSKIVLPSFIRTQERDYLIMHEMIHIKNHDNLIRGLGLIILCIHWFNPLVWVAYYSLNSDLEMRVDEEVIDIMGESIKKAYCLSLVDHALIGTKYRVISSSFAKKTLGGMEVKMRIKNLIKYKKIPSAVGLVIVAATLGITTVLSSCASEAVEKAETTVAETKISEPSSTTAEKTEGEYVLYYDKNGTVGVDKIENLGEQYILDDSVGTKDLTLDKISVSADAFKNTSLFDSAQEYSKDGYSLIDMNSYSKDFNVTPEAGFYAIPNGGGPLEVVMKFNADYSEDDSIENLLSDFFKSDWMSGYEVNSVWSEDSEKNPGIHEVHVGSYEPEIRDGMISYFDSDGEYDTTNNTMSLMFGIPYREEVGGYYGYDIHKIVMYYDGEDFRIDYLDNVRSFPGYFIIQSFGFGPDNIGCVDVSSCIGLENLIIDDFGIKDIAQEYSDSGYMIVSLYGGWGGFTAIAEDGSEMVTVQPAEYPWRTTDIHMYAESVPYIAGFNCFTPNLTMTRNDNATSLGYDFLIERTSIEIDEDGHHYKYDVEGKYDAENEIRTITVTKPCIVD